MVNGQLLQMNKSYSQLKNKQKEKIAGWMYQAYKKQVSEGLSNDEALAYILDKVNDAKIWIPAREVEQRYYSKKNSFRNRLAGESIPQHISQMQGILNRSIQKMDALEKQISEYRDFQIEIEKLKTYFESQQRKDDLVMDGIDKIPDKLKKGILSDDKIREVLDRNEELIERIR